MPFRDIKIPLTNIYAMGDYCAQCFIGSEQTPVNLIIDTGSSTLVIDETKLNSNQDKHLTSTSLAQEVNYGVGGFDGPVVHSSITVKDGLVSKQVSLDANPMALAISETPHCFGQADGILGLAFHHLNKSYDLQSYLAEHQVLPAKTYPWPFDGDKLLNSDNLQAFKKLLWQQQEQDITPYFTELVKHHLCQNKFAFYSLRSSIYYPEPSAATQQLAEQPLNKGFLIIGGGEQHQELYQGEFIDIPIVDDIYYNLTLEALQVGEQGSLLPAPALQADQQHSYVSNAIVDTGASAIVLVNSLYHAMLTAFSQINPSFTKLIEPFADIKQQSIGIAKTTLNLAQWPNLYFYFKNCNGATVKLKCAPTTYWQINTPTADTACFKLLPQLPDWPNQSILGLPLLNNYYTVFDRNSQSAQAAKGSIRFAPIVSDVIELSAKQ